MTEALIKFDQLLKCNIVDVSNKRTDNGVATAKKKKKHVQQLKMIGEILC